MNSKFCGICFNRPLKLYSINVFNLKVYFQEIMSQEVICALPRYFCYTCAALLYKYHKFKDKCCAAQKAISELMQLGPVSSSALALVNQEEIRLAHSLGIITETERVKTFSVVDKTLHSKIQTEPTKPVKIENKDTDSDTDDSTEFDNSIENTNNVIENEKSKSDDEKIEYVDKKTNLKIEKLNIAKQSILNDHTYLRNEEQTSNTQRTTVQVPHIVKKSADSGNLRVLVVGEIKTASVPKKIKNTSVDKKIKNTRVDKNIKNANVDKKIKNAGVVKKIKNEKQKKEPVIRRYSLPKNTARLPSGGKGKYKLKLNPKYWEVIRMSEPQAIAEYQSRATKAKYLKAQYKCDKCYTAFSSKMIMNKHMRLIHSEERGPYECPFCHRRYRINCLLSQHIVVHYTKYKCLRCSLEFNMELAVQNHDDAHSGLMRKCLHCDMEFRHKSTYYSHLRIYHRSEHVCNICGASFVSQKGLTQHDNLIHRTSDNKVEEVDNEDTYCVTCDIKFLTMKGYMEHFNESVKHAEEQHDFKISSKGTAKGAPLKGGATKSFEQVANKITTCVVCKDIFPSYSKYATHHRKEHKDVPVTDFMQLCEICGRSYKSSTIGFHMNIHTRERRYSCTTCGAQFFHPTSFTRHQMIHTGERPFKCPLCEKRFTQKVSMQIHHRTVHLKEPYPKRARRRKLETKV